ncbi:MAG: C40 family peptidase [Gemmatimonadota bacterium]|nr:C40 family peptidase [Gemmatimonadota bacterium]
MTSSEALASAVAAVEEVRRRHAPDPRGSVWEVKVELQGGTLALSGATTEPVAVHEVGVRLSGLGLRIDDRVVRLPCGDGAGFALIRVPIAPMLAAPLISEAQVSQVVLGHPLAVLRRWGRWLHCRSSDGYLGWIHRGYLVEIASWHEDGAGSAAEAWSLGAEVHDDDGRLHSRLPWGARVTLAEDGRVRLPGGEWGTARGELVRTEERMERFPASGNAVVESALRWIGAPYLWGGITHGGVDCSGLVQATLGLHGVHLPRDSDQQARVGERVDPGDDFARLRAGDLLFFAEDRERVSHVALSLGGSRIVHASLGNARVACNDLCGDAPYERELRSFFVVAQRVLPD